MSPLFKTTIVIWSEEDTVNQSLKRIGSDVQSDFTYCSSRTCELIEDPEKDEDWDGTDFFAPLGDDDDEVGDDGDEDEFDVEDDEEEEDLEVEEEDDPDEYN